ncbi:hypothetical protein K1719_028019 [Acacia pycnantha]|nr:hypothetical protein K1719_028019 [Acacia pycnantha]
METEAWERAAEEYQELLTDMCEQKLAPNFSLHFNLHSPKKEEKPEEGEEPKPEGEKKKVKKAKTEKYWDWEIANETKPLWMQNPKYLQKDEYQEFY